VAMSRLEKRMVNSERRQRARVEQARRLLSEIPRDALADYLEVGCGAGAVTRFAAADLGLNAVGIDIDPDQVERARTAGAGVPNLEFREADATRLPFEDARFDVVLSFMATHHIRGVQSALAEVARVLRPGGYFVYADIFLPAPLAAIGRLLGHGYALPRSTTLLELLRAAGFMPLSASKRGAKFYGPYESVLRKQPGAPGPEQPHAAQAARG
jgi:SAM-dependent methyltransferase